MINADRAKRSVSALAKKLQTRAHVLVGVQQGSGNYDDGPTIATIAAANHFGTTTEPAIPARPFLDVAIEENKRKYSSIVERQISDVLDGKKTIEQVLDSVGSRAAADVQDFINDLSTPPNAPSTIAAKGGESNPLVNDGTLRQSIHHQVTNEIIEEGL